jgi:hypothetical protein
MLDWQLVWIVIRQHIQGYSIYSKNHARLWKMMGFKVVMTAAKKKRVFAYH